MHLVEDKTARVGEREKASEKKGAKTGEDRIVIVQNINPSRFA